MLAASPIYRLYHSVAFLMPDGSILVAGSEQTPCDPQCILAAPTLIQYQAERFLPHYFFGQEAAARPVIGSISSTAVKMGQTLRIAYSGVVNSVVITSPAAVTHQNNMNQVVVKLKVVDASQPGSIVVRMPPASGVVAPPGPYMVWLMNGDIPCTQASWFTLMF